jgi:Flp pilus assembly protein TadB
VNIQTAGKTIEVIVAPAVMVTACGILLTGMLAHYSAINERLRALTTERLDLALVTPPEDHGARARERLTEIDHQVPMLISRHQQVHHAILLLNTAVVTLILSMFVIAAAALANSGAVGTVSLVVFLGGVTALLVGVGFMAVEVRHSHASVAYESMRVVGLPVTWVDGSSPPATHDGREENHVL